jgi:hypothetical protein
MGSALAALIKHDAEGDEARSSSSKGRVTSVADHQRYLLLHEGLPFRVQLGFDPPHYGQRPLLQLLGSYEVPRKIQPYSNPEATVRQSAE